MTSLELQYAECNGAFLEFFDGNRDVSIGTGVIPDVKFIAFLTDFSQTYSLTFDQEEVFGRNDPIMTYRSTKRTMSLTWDLPASDLFEAKVNKIKTRKLMRLLYPEYQNSYLVPASQKLTRGEEERLKIRSKRVEGSQVIGDSLFKFNEKNIMPADSLALYLTLKSELLFEDSYNSDTAEYTGQGGEVTQYEFSDIRHTTTMIKNPLVGIRYANLINASTDHLGAASTDPLLGWIDNLTITPNLEAGFFIQKSGTLQRLLTGPQKKAIGRKYRKVLSGFEEGGSFPKVYSLSCNFNVIHDKPMGWLDNNMGAFY